MQKHLCGLLAFAAGCAGASGVSNGQSISVDCTGANVPSAGTSAANVVRTSTATLPAAPGYFFSFNPMVHGTGFWGIAAIGLTPKPLGEVLNGFFVGGQRVLYGAMRNPAGTLPTRLDTEPVSGSFGNIFVSLTFKQELLADGRGQTSITDITKTASLGITIDSGGAVYTVWDNPPPPAPVFSEWQFEGNLQSVKESLVAWGTTSGPSKIRYLDDPAFGAILGGVGVEDTLPSPATPTGVTLTQSSFGSVSSFGLPSLGTSAFATTKGVFRTSPPRNAGDPGNTAKSRGIGLTLWPNTRDFWPDDRIGQWTMIWDLLIPQSSWDAARAINSGNGGQLVPLIEDSQNNNSVADVLISINGSNAGGAGAAKAAHSGVPQGVSGDGSVAAAAIQPNQWFRLALVVDHYARQQGRLFVNGTFIGTTGSDWVYNAVKSASPTWGDLSTGQTSGSPIASGTWNGWGQFPSPWAKQSTSPNAPTASTLSLFADITGVGQSVYIANLMFSDQAMTDAQILALGGPNARGVVYLRPEPPPPCAADFDHSGATDPDDLFAFLDAWFAQNGQSGASLSADVNHSGAVDADDLFAFLDLWFAENGACP